MNLLVWDKTQFANNNGEYFYRMARELRPGLKMSFVLSRKSVDWNRLKKDGFNLVPVESPQIPRLMRESTFMLFSNNPMPNQSRYRSKTIYMPHGISSRINDSYWYWSKYISPNAKYAVVSFRDEMDMVKKHCIPIVSGYPRHDILMRKSQEWKGRHDGTKQVFVSFHWRRSIGRKNRKEFSDSRYIAGINEFLNCPGLKELHDTKRVKVVFLPHLVFTEYVDMFDIPDFVEVPVGKPFQDLIVQSDALVTDFSSNSFEMAYLDKPTVAYVPDEGCSCSEWPYHEERFGDYENIIHCKKPEDAVKAMGDLLFNKRSFAFSQRLFKFVDMDNTRRLLEWMDKKKDAGKALPRSRKDKLDIFRFN